MLVRYIYLYIYIVVYMTNRIMYKHDALCALEHCYCMRCSYSLPICTYINIVIVLYI